jgi:hypothetical protein
VCVCAGTAMAMAIMYSAGPSIDMIDDSGIASRSPIGPIGHCSHYPSPDMRMQRQIRSVEKSVERDQRGERGRERMKNKEGRSIRTVHRTGIVTPPHQIRSSLPYYGQTTSHQDTTALV